MGVSLLAGIAHFIFLMYSVSLPLEHERFTRFRRLTIGQTGSSTCTNESGHKDTFSNKRHKVLHVPKGQQGIEPQAK